MHNRCHVGRTQYQYGRLLWRRCEAHGCLHHHPQRTLGPNHQLPQVIPSIVFDQASIKIEQLAGTVNDLQACHPITGHAVTNNLDAAGIGGNVAADLARATGCEINGIEQPALHSILLQLLGHCASTTAHCAVD